MTGRTFSHQHQIDSCLMMTSPLVIELTLVKCHQRLIVYSEVNPSLGVIHILRHHRGGRGVTSLMTTDDKGEGGSWP